MGMESITKRGRSILRRDREPGDGAQDPFGRPAEKPYLRTAAPQDPPLPSYWESGAKFMDLGATARANGDDVEAARVFRLAADIWGKSHPKYADAIEKYERVRENMKAYRDPEAQTLKKSCLLNSALCMNKVGRHEEAIERCEEVLKIENTSLKAYYRRGQGYFQLKNLELAWKDLKRAVKLSPEDEIVRGELEKCEEEMEKAGMVVEIKCPEFDTFEKDEGEEGEG